MADELFDGQNRLANSTSVPAGTLLFRRDEPSRCVYVVRRGTSLCSGPMVKRQLRWKCWGHEASSDFPPPSMEPVLARPDEPLLAEGGLISTGIVENSWPLRS